MMPRTKRLLASTFLAVSFAGSAAAVDLPSDAYQAASAWIEALSGIDPNAGMTSFPILNVPMGGRAEALGTAFAAVADDASFIEWNPAGSASLRVTELAFFHNNWIADTKVEGAVFATRFGNLGVAAGGKWLYLPFTEYDDYGQRVSKGHYSEVVGIFNASYNFFQGYYFDGLSLGASLKNAYRFVPDFADDDGKVVSGSGFGQSATSLMLDFGALTRFNVLKYYRSRERNASVGLTFRNFGPSAGKDALPTVATVAASYKPVRPVLITADLNFPMNLVNLDDSQRPYGAAGVTVQATSFLAMRAGLLLRSSNLRFSVGSELTLAGMDLAVTYTLDLLTQNQPLNRVSLAAKFDFGDGGRAARAKKVEELYLAGLEDYANGDTDRAFELWTAALELDPTFDPARESRNVLAGTRALEQRILDIQRLE